MAKRRMLSLDLMRSDAFLDLPQESQLLYLHLLIEADDDGFIFGKKRISAMLGMQEAHFAALTQAGFILPFPSGAAVIAHWPLFNKIPKDRYVPTAYQAEFAALETVPGIGYRHRKTAANTEETEIKEENTAEETQMPTQETPLPETNAQAPQYEETAPVSAPQLCEKNENAPRLPLLGGGEYAVTQKETEQWRALYPGVDLDQAFRNMRAWLISHPEKQKTADTIGRFINHWLLNEQNKPVQQPYTFGFYDTRRKKDFECTSDFDWDKWEEKWRTTVPKFKKRQR